MPISFRYWPTESLIFVHISFVLAHDARRDREGISGEQRYLLRS